jgi:triacylglycerol esterase/lipase EstA (alpha/beta hydrolase family)
MQRRSRRIATSFSAVVAALLVSLSLSAVPARAATHNPVIFVHGLSSSASTSVAERAADVLGGQSR